MLLRDSLSSSPQAAIAWISGPAEAYKLLKDQYSHSMGLQRDSLYREFHSLKYASGTNLAEFNARFNSLISRLHLAGAQIEPTDLINQYLGSLERAFPQWAERLRGTIRTLKATGQPTDRLNLQFLMADILEETRNPSSASYQVAKGEQKPPLGP